MENYRQKMVYMIKKLIEGHWSVDEFEKNYYLYFIDIVPDNYLSEAEEIDFFGVIQEKLDWITLNPDQESREYGWISHVEYIEFVKNLVSQFIKDNT